MTTLMKIIMNLFKLLEDSITSPLNIFDNSNYTNYEFDSVAEMLIIRKETKKPVPDVLLGKIQQVPDVLLEKIQQTDYNYKKIMIFHRSMLGGPTYGAVK